MGHFHAKRGRLFARAPFTASSPCLMSPMAEFHRRVVRGVAHTSAGSAVAILRLIEVGVVVDKAAGAPVDVGIGIAVGTINDAWRSAIGVTWHESAIELRCAAVTYAISKLLNCSC